MKQHVTKTALSATLLLTVMLLVWQPEVGAFESLSGTIAASDQDLSAIRGGFVTNEGLLVSFGIERAIYVNGILDAASNFTINRTDGSGSSNLQQTDPALSGINTVKVVQIGPDGSNVFSPDKIVGNVLPNGFTVIQNTLNNQFVKNTTTFNVSVTNSNLFRDMNLTSLISQQMINASR
jgi:hypothetical protein